MLCSVAAIVAASIACSDVFSPQLKQEKGAKVGGISPFAIAPPTFWGDSVQGVYLCGGRLLIRHAKDTPLEVKWRANGQNLTSDSGIVTLPARSAGELYSTTIVFSTADSPYSWLVRKTSTGDWVSGGQGQYAPCPSTTTVPETPSATWDSLVDPSNVVDSGPRISHPFIRNAIYVRFQDAASAIQRQAAIDSVEGEIVGGMLGGFFLVRIPQPGNALIDSTSGPVLRAATKLSAMSQVRSAIIALVETPLKQSYLSPYDGAGFRSWQLNPAKADSQNWAWEAISAPFAWGCQTGSARVGVIDYGFHAIPELAARQGNVHQYQPSSETNSHGTLVASIIAARGADSIGITGVMHTGLVELYQMRPNTGRATQPYFFGQLIAMGNAGIRVINMSLAIYHGRYLTPAKDSATARGEVEILKFVIDSLRNANRRPLFVIAAGNDNSPAWLSGPPALADSANYRTQLLVVGASARDSAIVGNLFLMTGAGYQAGSNWGSVIDIVAPGEEITTLSRTGDHVTTSGTSLAAPFVTGVAGLLLSNDSTLTSEQLRSLIVDGAIAGGRYVQDRDPNAPARTIPILNAYESLKLLARTNGTPLCGNRIWAENGWVFAERDNTSERLFHVEPDTTFNDPAAFTKVHHGGRRIDVFNELTYDEIQFDYNAASRSWSRKAPNYWPTTNGSPSGAYGSAYGESHNGDSAVIVHGSLVQLRIKSGGTWGSWISKGNISYTATGGNSTLECVAYDHGETTPCADTTRQARILTYAGSEAITFAFSPIEPVVYAAINYSRYSRTSIGDWQGCALYNPDGTPWYTWNCKKVTISSVVDSARIVRFDLSDGTTTHKWSIVGARVLRMAISEDAKELAIWQTAGAFASEYFGVPTQPQHTLYALDGNTTGSWSPCENRFLLSSNGTELRAITGDAYCNAYDGAATFAALRMTPVLTKIELEERLKGKRRN